MEIINEWFEVWYVEGVEHIPAYLVVVAPNLNNEKEIIILDITDGKILFNNENYEDVRNWLIEDGFIQVQGRESKY